MGEKSRGNFKTGTCLKECGNRHVGAFGSFYVDEGLKTYKRIPPPCETCIRFSNFVSTKIKIELEKDK